MRGPIDSAIRWLRHSENAKPGENDNGRDAKADPESVLADPPRRTDDGSSALTPVFRAVPNTAPGAMSYTAPPMVEDPWLARLDEAGIPRSLVYPSTTLGRMLDQTAERFADATALVYAEKNWNYRELLSEVNRLAGGLARLGVRRGDRIVVTLPNCPEYVFCFFAIQKLGAVVVNAGPLMGSDDLEQLLTMTAARVVIGLDLQAPLLGRVGKDSTVEHWVWVSLAFYQSVFKRLGYQLKLWHERDGANRNSVRTHHVTFAALMEDAPSRPPTVDPGMDATAVLQPTGGTTGGLKLVQLSHRNLLCNATQMSVWVNGRLGQERTMAVLPMFHVYGLTTGLINTVYIGGQILMMTRFEPEPLLNMIERHKPTIFPLVPAICDGISDFIEKEPRPLPLASVRLCISGAAPLTQGTAERFERLGGTRVIEGYGLSEASPVTHVNLPGKSRFGSIGLPMPDTFCRIVEFDENGEKSGRFHDVRTGEAGELLISGPQVMSGYFANPAQTRIALVTDPDGRAWLRTGDVARMDEDGYFHIVDRKKDMIIRSGLKVYPAKVEKVLRMHERVLDAGVIGRPDPVHTEEVVAFVVPAGGVEDRDALAEELRRFCRKHLAPYEVPQRVEFAESLPRSALGKLLKRELRLRPPLPMPTVTEQKPADGVNGDGHDPKNPPGRNGRHTQEAA